MARIEVELGKRSYPVIVGSNISGRLPAYLRRHVGDGRIFAIYDAQVYALYGNRIRRLISRKGKVSEFVVPGGEKSKSRAQLNRLHDFLLSQRISRSDTILACGGGVVSDLTGFAAATIMRGIRWVALPTTLIGMVDAAIGGKTAINHPSGKNLIGAFWQPSLVWCDLEFLLTLPESQMINGLGEVLKYAGLIGGTLVGNLSDYVHSADLYDLKKLQPMVEDCVRYKARAVSSDERDSGPRMMLNLGHSFGHALEVGAGYGRLLHGEALVLGLKAALQVSAHITPVSAMYLSKYTKLVESFVSLVPRRKINLSKTIGAMQLDKKRRGERLKIILLRKPGNPYIVDDITITGARKALKHALSGFALSGG